MEDALDEPVRTGAHDSQRAPNHDTAGERRPAVVRNDREVAVDEVDQRLSVRGHDRRIEQRFWRREAQAQGAATRNPGSISKERQRRGWVRCGL